MPRSSIPPRKPTWDHDDPDVEAARAKALPLSKSAVQPRPTEQSIGFRPCLPPSPRRVPPQAPESIGKIVLLVTGRFGALSPRDQRGRRKPLGAFDTLGQADDRLRAFRKGGPR